MPESAPSVSDERRAQLAANLERVTERVHAAAEAAGRSDLPKVIVVTKFFPVEDLVALAELGVADIGENREQELTSKVEYLNDHRRDLLDSPTRHFIGQLQSKKAAKVARAAHVVHSLDRAKLVPILDRAADAENRVLPVMLQVSLDEADPGRGGVAPADLNDLAAMADEAEHLELCGLMAVAPLGESPAPAFERLAKIREGFLRRHPKATALSAGMSSDLEDAVAIGATHLRVGSAILGSRPADG